MTTDLTLPASLLAPQPRGRKCVRCGGSLYRDEDGDWRCFSCCRLYAPPEHVEPEARVGRGVKMNIGRRAADKGVAR